MARRVSRKRHDELVEAEFRAQPLAPAQKLTEGDIAHLPLVFNDRHQLVDFQSDDRPDSSSGRFIPMSGNTPLSDHRRVGGLFLPTRGSAVYSRPDGPFTYGGFTVGSIAYNLAEPSRR